MGDFTAYVKAELKQQGADLVGVGSLAELPSDVRGGFPLGVSVAVKYPKSVIRGIASAPTAEYRAWYDILNDRLDALVTFGEALLTANGYNAEARTREKAALNGTPLNTALPHKTVATRGGVGFIGKCALLVTEPYGSMVRLSSILTDAPLAPDEPINAGRCGGCRACADACPAGAVSGSPWSVGVSRETFFDPIKCRETARQRARIAIGEDITQCGKCIEACPYTRRYIKGAGE